MIQILINSEALDIDTSTLVTFKKSQQLNGIQDQYSYSNNFTVKNTSKNRRLLGFNYLPNSKAKAMTAGYDCDVILNRCIFLKRQKVKVQKETSDGIPIYLVFSDSLFVVKAKELLLTQVVTGVDYTKTLANFQTFNLLTVGADARTAPISAQDASGFVVVEEVPILLNVQNLFVRIIEQLGYSFTGDILTDDDLKKYYTNSNIGVYGPDGTPQFDTSKTVYDFITDFLRTFNGYLEVSDSSKMVGVYLWKNIESIKDRFTDYSDKFVNFKEYTFEGGLAKINDIKYSDSPDFYNGFFDNNKSIVERSTYLVSNFGAGSMRLFDDQELSEFGALEARVVGETTEPQTLNLYRFEDTTTNVPVYYNGVLSYISMYKAYSPAILEIWQLFHQAYCKNISLPTTGLLTFRYDAILLNNFKMQEVFFIKQLAAFWLPLELNFTTAKDAVTVKALMIERTAIDSPAIFDFNLSVDFYGSVTIEDIFLLYSAANVSPAATMTITAADLTKNNIYINGTPILAFPTSVSVSAGFEFLVENIEAVNVKSNSNISFEFVSQEGGISRVGNINVAHNGRANFLSEFRSELDTVYSYGRDDVDNFSKYVNYSGKITIPINILNTFSPLIGEQLTFPPIEFKALEFVRDSNLEVELTVEELIVHCSNRGGGARAETKVKFVVFKNGAIYRTVYSAGTVDQYKTGSRTNTYNNVVGSTAFSVLAGDVIIIGIEVSGDEQNRIGSGTMNGSASFKNVIWKFRVSEQL